MSLISRCPACKTTFKVVPDQLRISQGWVRCGQCAEIFDGSAHLVDDPGPPTPAQTVAVAVSAEPATRTVMAIAAADQASPTSRAEPSLDLAALNGYGPLADAAQPEPVQAQAPPALPMEAIPDAPPEAMPETLADGQPEVSFIRKARGPSGWARSSVRVLSALLLLGLTGLLAGQLAYRERDRIAVLYPQLKPHLDGACEPFKCKVMPLRQIESITIENSSFTKVRGDTYRLSVGLKNASPFELAMPAVELTLTDVQDQAVIRRVVTAAEFGSVSATLAGDAEWTGSVSLNLRAGALGGAGTGGGVDRVAGYRILAFYP